MAHDIVIVGVFVAAPLIAPRARQDGGNHLGRQFLPWALAARGRTSSVAAACSGGDGRVHHETGKDTFAEMALGDLGP